MVVSALAFAPTKYVARRALLPKSNGVHGSANNAVLMRALPRYAGLMYCPRCGAVQTGQRLDEDVMLPCMLAASVTHQ